MQDLAKKGASTGILVMLMLTAFVSACGSLASSKPPAILVSSFTGGGKTDLEPHLSGLMGADGKQLWHYQPAASWSFTPKPPVTQDGIVYIPADTHSPTNKTSQLPSGTLYALSVSDGHLLWQTEVGAMASSPVVDQGKVYISALHSAPTGKLEKWFYALNAQNGKPFWHVQIPNGFGFVTMMKLMQGTLYMVDNPFSFGGGEVAEVYALRASDGQLLWRREIKDMWTHLSDPVVMDSIVYISHTLNKTSGPAQFLLQALDAADGRNLWQATFGQSDFRGDLTRAAFTALGSRIYLGASTGSNALRPDSWDYTLMSLDAKSGKPLWHIKTDGPSEVTATRTEALYVQTKQNWDSAQPRGQLSAVKASNGQWLWRSPIQTQCLALIPTEQVVYCQALDLEHISVIAFKADTGQRLWQTAPQTYLPSGFQTDSFQLVQGILYTIEQADTVVAIQASGGKVLWRSKVSGNIVALRVGKSRS